MWGSYRCLATRSSLLILLQMKESPSPGWWHPHGILNSEVPAQLLITQPLALLLTPFGKLCVFWCFFDTLLSVRGKALLSFKVFTVLAMESEDVTPKSATRTRTLPSHLMI